MSSLEEALHADVEKEKSRTAQQKAKPRLVADPCMAVGDIMKVFLNVMFFKGSKDFMSLISPPASGPRVYNWKTRPAADWMLKTTGLFYDLLDIASNGNAFMVGVSFVCVFVICFMIYLRFVT